MSPESWQSDWALAPRSHGLQYPARRTRSAMPGWLRRSRTPYSVGYVGVSFHDEIAKAGIGTAALQELRRRIPAADAESIEAAAAALWPRTPPDERLTLVNAPGANAYPLINYEYAVVSKSSRAPRPPLRCAVFCYGRSRPTKQTRNTSRTRTSFPCLPTSGCSVTDALQFVKRRSCSA